MFEIEGLAKKKQLTYCFQVVVTGIKCFDFYHQLDSHHIYNYVLF